MKRAGKNRFGKPKAGEQTPRGAEQAAGKQAVSVKEDLLFLLLKVAILAALLLTTFVLIFGLTRNSGNTMFPAIKDGDLALYYRLENTYNVSDVVVLEKDGETQLRRILAREGDVVDITADGLRVNGYPQQESGVYTETLPYREGITFPLTLGDGEYFVLGDDRTNTRDSRIYGSVHESEIKGVVITLLRRRGI